MSARDPAGLRRCRALLVAVALGLVLVVAGVIDRGWASVGAGVVGSAVALVVYWRTCGRRGSRHA
jgi:hypothetical protein